MSILIFNLTRLKYIVDYDSSVPLAQAIEMWQQKTIFLKGWAYQTTLGWDTTSILLAAPLYGITKNIFTAYGISNNCIVLALAFFLNRIGKDLEIRKAHNYFAISLVFTVFTHHQLGYADNLFANSVSYGGRVLTVIILLSVMVRLTKRRTLHQEAVCVLLCMLLLFFAGASTGSYILICGIFPLFLYTVWSHISKDQLNLKILKDSRLHFLCLSALSMLAGMVIIRQIYPQNLITPGTKTLSSAGDLLDNIGAALVGIIELLGGISTWNYTIFSEEGILTLLGFIMVCALFISAYHMFNKALKNYTVSQSCGVQYSMLLLWLFFVNLFCLSYADLTYGSPNFEIRYWLISIVPMFLIIGQYLTEIAKKNKGIYRAFFGVLIISTSLFSLRSFISYYQTDNNADALEKILEDISDRYEIETLYVVDNVIEGRVMRTLTQDFDIIGVDEALRLYGWGGKISGFGLNNIAVLTQASIVGKNPVLKENCSLLQSFDYGQYNLYACNPGVFNFHIGLPAPEESEGWDTPMSGGYCIDNNMGEINEAGELASNGTSYAGYLLYGPYTESVAGTYDITLHYIIDKYEEELTGVFDVALDAQSWDACPFDATATSATLEAVSLEEGHLFEARVWIPEGMVVRIQSIEYQRVAP